MKLIAPDYYLEFKCTADRCSHSCCIGWEIDVDEESLRKYETLSGNLGEEIRAAIITEDGCAHFRLLEGERCPFLDGENLCRLQRAEGEALLCQICRDHPRFYSEFSHCTETGLGLSCEAAAELILSRSEPMTLMTLSDDEGDESPDEFEAALLALRCQLLALLEDTEWSLEERLQNILALCGIALPEKTWTQWAEIYSGLERLDSAWDAVLDTLSLAGTPLGTEWDVPFRNLAAYFLYRHLPAALYDGDCPVHAAFAVLSTMVIRRLFAAAPEQDMPTLVELCRLYSTEIEYSMENTDALAALFAEE